MVHDPFMASGASVSEPAITNGTSTPVGDTAELDAVRKVFGGTVAVDDVTLERTHWLAIWVSSFASLSYVQQPDKVRFVQPLFASIDRSFFLSGFGGAR